MLSTESSYTTFSLDHQDEFVLRLFHAWKPGQSGTFLDVGCLHGIHGNNTFTLENAGWKGQLISEGEIYVNENRKLREAPCHLADLTCCDWNTILGNEHIEVDYISFVAAPNERFSAILLKFPWNIIRFSICTLRHFDDSSHRDLARRIMSENGYLLLAGNVSSRNDLTPYEDWFIDAAKIPSGIWQKYASDSVRAIDVFYEPKVATNQTFTSCSSDLQDEFVMRLFLTKNPDFKGTYLDIGCGHGYKGNNTFLLEDRGWTGYLVDIDKDAFEWNVKYRTASKSFCEDVTVCDWNALLGKSEDEKRLFDYISFDVDEATMGAVNNFPWDTVRFRVMTIEHDTYRFGPAKREYIRELMRDHGYLLVAGDVLAGFNGGPFEDWFVDPLLVPEEDYMPYMTMWSRAIDVLYKPKV